MQPAAYDCSLLPPTVAACRLRSQPAAYGCSLLPPTVAYGCSLLPPTVAACRLRLQARLAEQVVGQDEALRVVSDAVRVSRAGLQAAERPLGAFLLVGPTGTRVSEE